MTTNRSNAQPMKDGLWYYVVYDHPSDYPNFYVVRRWHNVDGQTIPDEALIMQRTHLEDVQEQLARLGLVNIGRRYETDRAILEIWI